MSASTAKTILLTGAEGGIGSALSRALHGDGANLVLHGRDPDKLHALADEAGLDAGRIAIQAHDVTDRAAVDDAVRSAIGRFGSIDVLINLAGINRFGGILHCSEEEWDAVMDVNAKGYFLTTRAVMPAMKQAGAGTIINMSSIWGVRGNPRMMAYATSKHAVEGFTASLRAEAGPWGIKVSSLIVGIVDTPFRDAMREHVTFTDEQCSRMLQPADVVQAIRYMLSTSAVALPSSITLEAWRLQ